jgi:RNA polymerase sigma-70 factor, ECF subfamily
MPQWMTSAQKLTTTAPAWRGIGPTSQVCDDDLSTQPESGDVNPAKAAGQRRGEEIVGYIPALRIFARSLCRNQVEADDLVQETLLRAIERADQFEAGTNLRAWLFTIMRNRFYTNWTKRVREPTGEKDCISVEPQASAETQTWHLRMREMEAAMADLPSQYREALMLVAVLGESYIEAAQILGCDIGTIKSRVNRGRAALRDTLDQD